VSNQFANGFGDYQTAEALGVGPHVTPMRERADHPDRRDGAGNATNE